MEQEEFKQLKEQNEQYMQQLSKRSYDYIFKLRKVLQETMDVESQEKALAEVLPGLVQAQKKGMTAVQLYGPVNECADMILHPKKEARQLKPWQIWLDNSLLTLALLGLLAGLMGIGSQSTANAGMSRLLTLLLSAMAGGLTFYYFNKLIFKYDLPGADKKKKPKFWKQLLIMVVGIIAWWIVMQLTVFIPNSINIVIPPIFTIAISGIAYLARYIMKKSWGYKSQFFTVYYEEESR